jgi:choline kinase
MYVVEIDDKEEIERIMKALKNKNVKMRLVVETDSKNLYAALLRHYKARAYVIRRSSGLASSQA